MIGPEQDHPNVSRPLWQYWFGRAIAGLLGWDFVGPMPPHRKMVVLSGPHTSNWDFVLMVCASFIYRVRILAMAKDSLFRFPMGPLMRALGCVPIDRTSPHGVVDQMVKLVNRSESILVIIPASGTRKRKDHWRSGFYWLARKANIPIAMSYTDYRTKTAGFKGALHTTDDIAADMDRIREVYSEVMPKFIENRSDIRLRDEGEADEV